MTSAFDDRTGKIDYGRTVILDAENLAELGIQKAYVRLAPHFAALGIEPQPITEHIDDALAAYTVECGGLTYSISGPAVSGNSWALATWAFFDIVNRQLKTADVSFYALGAGNDLHGAFLTPSQVERARRVLTRRSDWPYLPAADGPFYGMSHDESPSSPDS